MSAYSQLTPEAQLQLRLQKRNSLIVSFFIAILFCILIGLIFWMFRIYVYKPTESSMVTYQAEPFPENEPTAEKIVKRAVAKKPSPASSAAQVIVSQAPSNVSLPTPEVEVDTLSLDFGESEGFGDGWGSGAGNGFQSGDTGTSYTLMGKVSDSGLKGSFYDLKTDEEQKINDIGRAYQINGSRGKAAYEKELASILKNKFKARKLKSFYKAESEVSFTQMVIPQMSATIAPKSFQAGDNLKGSGWVVVYEGKISAEKPGYYRFVGQFDDVMFVLINGRVVLDGSWSSFKTPDNTKKVFPQDSPRIIYPHVNNSGSQAVPMRAGRYIKIGKETKIKIIIGESPGGYAGGGLFIQEKGKKYKKHESGTPILPPFTTEPLREQDKKRLAAISYYPMELEDVPVFRPVEQ